ncbi:MAG: radical SAM protein, partial [Candidatus Dadabacteria bacterium]
MSASSPFSARSAYVHVPFCTARCRYCAFYSGEPLDRIPRFLRALEREIEAWGPGAGPLDTVYVGGGTPGLLGAEGLTRILEALRRVRGIAPGAEITIEVNPGAGPDPGALRRAGVTRVSVGVQALDDRWLQTLGRRHGAAEALAYLSATRSAGVRSVSADLLIGLPGLGAGEAARWARDCVRAGADHVSVYVLELHEGTPLHRAAGDGRFPWPAPD